MSQRAVEAILGRLITDVEFRLRFFAESIDAFDTPALGLTARETAALLRVRRRTLEQVAAQLDPRIVREIAIPSPRLGSASTDGAQHRGRRAAAPSPCRESHA
jgi:hypothetical protein